MARKKTEVNAIRGERLGKLLKKNGIDQNDFAATIGYTEEHISYIINGKRNLTESAAKRVVSLIPGTRIEWLMGYDKYETEFEKGFSEFAEWDNEWKNRLNSVRVLAYLAGYEINLFPENNGMDLDAVFSHIKSGYQISKDGKVLGHCPLEHFNLLALDIQELTEQRIKSYLREVSTDG